MKELHFSKKYFKKEILDDPYSKIRVVIKEIPCLEISEEEYSLRVSTKFEDSEGYDKPTTVHRDMAIEHHLPPSKHSFPHFPKEHSIQKANCL